MRLIDADALREQLQNLAYDDWNQGVSTSWADAYREIADMVDDAPTIEPERKKGKWIKFPVGWKCSNCTLGTNDKGADSFNFCPNCDCDMSGEQE